MMMKTRHFDPTLYFILNLPTPSDPWLLVEKVVQGGITALQLRGKQTSARELYDLAVKLRPYLLEHDVKLIINDRVDVALAAQADGVHLGKDDLPLQACRHFTPNLLIGVSCYGDLQRAKDAARLGADYVAFGAFFKSSTKPQAPQIPLSILQKARAELEIPIVAIGGIHEKNAAQLFDAGTDGIAVISAIQNAPDPQSAAKKLRSLAKSSLHS